jgi:hypothetical protein
MTSNQLPDALPDDVDEKLRIGNDFRGVLEKIGMHK